MAFSWKDALGSIAPTLAAALSAAGPVGMAAGGFLSVVSSAVLGHPNGSADDVQAALTHGLTPEAVVAIKQADAALAATLAQVAAQREKARLDADTADATVVNATMQTEAKSDHWPTYTWRPVLGFCVGFNTAASSVLVLAVFGGVLAHSAEGMAAVGQLPTVLGALAGINATVLPILGIASWFRGKMQADPNVPTDNRG